MSQVTDSCDTEMIKNALLIGDIQFEHLRDNLENRLMKAHRGKLLIRCEIQGELAIKFSTDVHEFRNGFAGFNHEQLVAQMAVVRREIAWLTDNGDDFFGKPNKPNPENEEYKVSLLNEANEDRSNADRRRT